MRTSIESRSFLFVVFSLLLITQCFAAYSWRDCGDKLNRVFTYHSATVYPDPIIGGDEVALNVAAVIGTDFIWTGNEVEVFYNGVKVMFVNTTDMCDLTRVLSCPLEPMPISYTEIFNVPTLPSGQYVFRIRNLFGMEEFQREVGCLELTVDITNPTSTSCNYKSFAEIGISEVLAHFPDPNLASAVIGDWIQVGPAFGNPTFADGKLSYVKTSSDLINDGLYDDVADLIWGLNGTLYSKTNNNDGTIDLKYNGVFFVGYIGTQYPTFITLDNALINGTFDWTFHYDTKPINPFYTVSGTLQVLPKLGIQPTSWPYPLGFGRLDNFTLTQQSVGSTYIVQASQTINTCSKGSAGSTPSSQKTAVSPTDNWNDDQKWALALGIVGAFLILLIPFLLWLAWRQRKNQYYLNDDDLVDPLKPDYGSLAINDIIEDAEDLPRQ